MITPHPKLIPLLIKHGLDWETYTKRGRPAVGVRDKRAAIVTELHSSGCSWADMIAITGLSQGSIQRLTQAMWNPESRKRVREIGKSVGESWTGKKRPGQLEAQWVSGTFDFHRGRVRSEKERAKLRAGWTPKKRQRGGEHSRQRVWGNPESRARLMAFHQDPVERARRSEAQVKRMVVSPGKYLRGKAQLVETPKGTRLTVRVRSSYEVAAIQVLEANPNVVQYEYERCVKLPDGHWIIPDFIVRYSDGHTTLVEVKAAWVLNRPPSDRAIIRLGLSKKVAADNKWDFRIWTEKELGDAIRRSK